MTLDSRTTPAREDLAAAWLRDRVTAARYVEGRPFQVVRDGAPLKFKPEAAARLESQLLLGENFTVYDRRGGWAWGQNEADGYVGYVPEDALSVSAYAPTHRVAALMTHLYPAPDLKRPAENMIGMGSAVRVTDLVDGFCRISTGDWIYAKHLVEMDYATLDLVGTAMKFLGVPYLWGGRSAWGLDCSALVQLALAMCGFEAPRDSDMQEQQVGRAVPMADPHDFVAIEDGDLVFFPGHCGIFMQGWRFLHANAFDMQVSLHSFSDVLDRADADRAGVTSVRRVLSFEAEEQNAAGGG